MIQPSKSHRALFPATFILLVASVTGVYWNHFHNDFEFDDSHTILNNLSIRNLRNVIQFFTDASTHSTLPSNQSYRPIATLSFAVDYFLGGGLVPFYFQLSTFLWFMIQGLCMFFVFKAVMDAAFPHAGNRWTALSAVGLYWLHPANAETVNYICARTDVLSTCAVMASFALYLRSPFARRRHLHTLPFAVGMLAKATAMAFPFLLFAYALYFERDDVLRRPWREEAARALKNSASAFLVGVAALFLIKHMTPSTWTPGGVSHISYFLTQPYVWLHYMKSFFLPLWLSADTDWVPVSGWTDPRIYLGACFVGVLIYLIARTSRRKETRPAAFGLFWFAATLLPTSAFYPLSEVTNDHRMFFPFVGLSLAVVWTAFSRLAYPRSRRPRASVLTAGTVILVLGGYAYGTVRRNRVWHTPETLWLDVTKKSPRNGRGLMNYGLTQMEKGRLETAREYYWKALEYNPYYGALHLNLGIVSDCLGKPQEAEAYFLKALRLDPGNPETYFFYARWLAAKGRSGEAITYLKKARELSPAHTDVLSLMDEVSRSEVAKKKDLAEKASDLEKKVSKGGTAEDFLNLGYYYYEAGDFQNSIRASREALRRDPRNARTYNNLGASYGSLKMWEEEISACEKALSLQPDFPLAKNNLEWAKEQLKKKSSSPR